MTGPSDVWTVRRVLAWTTQHFEKKGEVDSPRLTAEVLLAHVLHVTRVRLYVDLDRPLEKAELAAFRALLERRVQGEPTQYLTGEREFYNRTFVVDARVLIPRPETELLVEAILRFVAKDTPATLIDLCTGSGCVSVSLAAERPLARVWATDLSLDACAVARLNADRQGVSDRLTVLEGDLDVPLPEGLTAQALAANPPYIARGELATLQREVQREPRLALDGGEDGLDLIRRVAESGRRRLEPGGVLAMEIGETQGEAVRTLLAAAGFEDVRVEKDLERRDRVALALQPRGA